MIYHYHDMQNYHCKLNLVINIVHDIEILKKYIVFIYQNNINNFKIKRIIVYKILF